MEKVLFRQVKELDLTIAVVTGEITLDDVLEAANKFYQIENVTQNAIWDLTYGGMNMMSLEDIQYLSTGLRENSEMRRGGVTILVSDNEMEQFLLRFFADFTSSNPDWPISYQVCESQKEAIVRVRNFRTE